jgi:hypothetical protein
MKIYNIIQNKIKIKIKNKQKKKKKKKEKGGKEEMKKRFMKFNVFLF